MADTGVRTRRRRRVALALLCSAVLLAAAIWTDVQARARTRQTDAALAAEKARLSSLRQDVERANTGKLETATTERALELQIDNVVGQLGAVDSQLDSANVNAYLQGASLTTLQACLGGVQHAMDAIHANRSNAAARALSDVAGPCTQLDGGAQAGLVYPFDFPDPDILSAAQNFYAYASNSVAGNVQILTSTDLTNWKAVGNALPSLPSWANANHTWSPSVALLGGTYVMYYAVQVAASGLDCISVATAARPQGPFIDRSSGPLVCQQALGGSIDPAPFFDPGGGVYLVWKSDGAGHVQLWSQPLAASGTSTVPGTTPTAVLNADRAWEGGNVEAPDMVWTAGRYWLFFSGNDWNTPGYAIGVASCAGPLGPCHDASPNPILTSGQDVSGPGGESVFSERGGAFHIAFHGWVPGAVGFPNSRDLYIRSLDLSGAVPVVGAAP